MINYTVNINGSAIDPNRRMKQAIWLYFFLLIFEGALRKWVLPGMSDLLLVVRDPIALYLVIKGWQKGMFKANYYVLIISILTLISFYTTFFWGHGNLYVSIYGARIYLLHFPAMFIIGQVFTRNDVIKLGKMTLWLAIPMLALIIMQFYSPQTAWVNRGIGGIGSAGFDGLNGYFRPPGTFSFTIGNTLFWSWTVAYVFYFWLHINDINRILLISATIAVLGSITFSISRTLFFQVFVSLFFLIVAIAGKPKYLWRIVIATICISAFALALGGISEFQTSIEVLTTRFTFASDAEGGLKGTLIDRFLGGMFGAVTQSTEMPLWGHGLGMGTNVGAQLLSGKVGFLISEGEWGRVIGEMGVLIGLSIIVLRIIFVTRYSKYCYHAIRKNNPLPWLLLSFGFLTIIQGQWAQPTVLGFSTMIGGVIIASFNTSKNDGN